MALFPHPLRDRLRQRVIDAAVAKGASVADATTAVDEVATDRPLLDWLFNGGFDKLVQLILEIIALMPKTPAP